MSRLISVCRSSPNSIGRFVNFALKNKKEKDMKELGWWACIMSISNPFYADGFSQITDKFNKEGDVRYIFKGSQVIMMIVIILANSVGPDEMQRFAEFHLGLHCLPKYPFRGFQFTKG